jgi:uroporphyrinogen-III synthase
MMPQCANPMWSSMPRADDGKRLDAGAVHGATIVVTRPAGTGASLARAVRDAGGHALLVPGLRLRACAGARIGVVANACDLWVFTSPAAARFAFEAGLRPGHHRVAVIAVGEGTRAALARLGLPAVAPSGRGDSEALLALPALSDVRDRRIALFGAAGGRDVIAPGLRARGATVEAVHVYERLPPRLTRRHVDAITGAREPLVMLVSSGEAVANIASGLPSPALQRLRSAHLVASSARVAALAHAHGFSDISIAESALPRDLLAAAAGWLARPCL